MIRHFGNHFGRFDVQDPIKAAAMVGTLGGVSGVDHSEIVELQAKAVVLKSAIVLKTFERKLKRIKKDLANAKSQGKLAVGVAEKSAETILALIDKWNS